MYSIGLTDDDGAVDRHGVHHRTHGLDGHLIGVVTVALPHRVGAGNGRLFDDA
jgi:hypothetical protein